MDELVAFPAGGGSSSCSPPSAASFFSFFVPEQWLSNEHDLDNSFQQQLTVSRMDKASLLADAVSYISQLRARVALLEAQAAASARQKSMRAVVGQDEERLEVRTVGDAAALLRLVTTSAAPPARLMAALMALDLPVQHACVSRVHGCPPTVVQDVVVDVPGAGMRDQGRLRAALLRKLQQRTAGPCSIDILDD